MPEDKRYSLKVGEEELYLLVNSMADQANGKAILGYGETIVLTTAVMGRHERAGIDYFPLSVEYEERFYAAGKIKGSRFIKREGRPSDEAILSARLIDRAIRPLFNKKIRFEVQVVGTTISFDSINDSDVIALNGASLALALSDIPWDGPVGCVRIGLINDKFIINPTYEQRRENSLDLVVAGTKNRVNMLEGKAMELPEEKVARAIAVAHEEIKKIIAWQEKIIAELAPAKSEIQIQEADENLKKIVNGYLDGRLEKIIYIQDKMERAGELGALKKEMNKVLEEQGFHEKAIGESGEIYEEKIDEIVHKNIIERDKRPDGRALDEVRPITCRVGLLPRAHGSALFTRGDTQALSSVTLASPGMEQYLDSMETTNGKKRFMHHYNFPPFSVGETGRYSGPGRREIGHGALAEKALESVIPSKDKFPYTIRAVTEILASNGSSSMASVCGSSLALMDAGAPIKEAVAGIAMGLMSWHDGRYKILTDIQGPEDHHGDMDCKIAGTKNGICAIQMDVKIEGATPDTLKEVIEQAKKARLGILKIMNQTISAPKEDLSKYAPRIVVIQINPGKIGAVIGPGGKTINEIIAETGAQIDIEETGRVFVTSENKEGADKAIERIKNLTREAKVGEMYQGKVVKIMDFGAFVEIFPGQDGLVHISELADYRVEKVSDILKMGDIIPVKIKGIEPNGKISLSLKAARSNNNDRSPRPDRNKKRF